MRALLFFVVVTPSLLFAQASPSSYPYLLRLAHEDAEHFSCVLLQTSGAYHMEVEDGDTTRVLEGIVSAEATHTIEAALQRPELRSLVQSQIEEPLLRSQDERLEVGVFRQDHWQDLLFNSKESEQPFETSLQPLLHLFSEARKASHKVLTEDEGKQNCLPRSLIALKLRPSAGAAGAERSQGFAKSLVASTGSPAGAIDATSISRTSPQAHQPDLPSALLRVDSLSVRGGSAHQYCILVTQEGKYRFENRTQNGAKNKVNSQVFADGLASTDLDDLKQILNAPAIEKIRHHEPPGGRVFVMGDMLELTIWRSQGVQHLVLTSESAGHLGAFFGGDAPISDVRPLTKFLIEHIESNRSGAQDPATRNNCAAP